MIKRTIRVVSDLHLEFDKNKIPTYETVADYTVIAGDVTTLQYAERDMPDLADALLDMTRKRIFMVLGNHEYYGVKDHPDVVGFYKRLCEPLGIRVLENETEDGFFGATMWTDVTERGFKRLTDSWWITDRNKIHRMWRDSKQALAHSEAEIVVTHHMPSPTLVHPKYGGYWDGFASELDGLIRPPRKLWIYGHTHTKSDTHIHDVRCVCNPRGYPDENREFEDLVVAVVG